MHLFDVFDEPLSLQEDVILDASCFLGGTTAEPAVQQLLEYELVHTPESLPVTDLMLHFSISDRFHSYLVEEEGAVGEILALLRQSELDRVPPRWVATEDEGEPPQEYINIRDKYEEIFSDSPLLKYFGSRARPPDYRSIVERLQEQEVETYSKDYSEDRMVSQLLSEIPSTFPNYRTEEFGEEQRILEQILREQTVFLFTHSSKGSRTKDSINTDRDSGAFTIEIPEDAQEQLYIENAENVVINVHKDSDGAEVEVSEQSESWKKSVRSIGALFVTVLSVKSALASTEAGNWISHYGHEGAQALLSDPMAALAGSAVQVVVDP
jgi:hypothetical protein